MKCRAHIDARYDQQFGKSLLRSKQDDQDEKNIYKSVERKKEDMKCRTHIDVKYDQ